MTKYAYPSRFEEGANYLPSYIRRSVFNGGIIWIFYRSDGSAATCSEGLTLIRDLNCSWVLPEGNKPLWETQDLTHYTGVKWTYRFFVVFAPYANQPCHPWMVDSKTQVSVLYDVTHRYLRKKNCPLQLINCAPATPYYARGLGGHTFQDVVYETSTILNLEWGRSLAEMKAKWDELSEEKVTFPFQTLTGLQRNPDFCYAYGGYEDLGGSICKSLIFDCGTSVVGGTRTCTTPMTCHGSWWGTSNEGDINYNIDKEDVKVRVRQPNQDWVYTGIWTGGSQGTSVFDSNWYNSHVVDLDA